jgi:hypothetical protein
MNTGEVEGKVYLKQTTNAQRAVDVFLYSVLNLGARWGWVVSATPRPLHSRERPSTHCFVGSVGPTTDLEGCGRSRHHRHSIRQPSSP